MLDQTMLFLSLANYLHDGVVWRHFAVDPLVRAGLEKLPEYAKKDASALKIYTRRDKGSAKQFIPLELK